MKIVVVDYGSGNLRSAAKALERVAEGPVQVTADPELVSQADYLIVPGQGAFADCLSGVKAIDGLYDAIADFALEQAKPYLGICVGMQLMATRGLEHGVHDGFGWIPGDIAPIKPSDPSLKIPQMGWNTLQETGASHPVLDGLAGEDVYFVHSYAFETAQADHQLMITDYAGDVTAVVGRDNVIGTQFHPENEAASALDVRVFEEFLDLVREPVPQMLRLVA